VEKFIIGLIILISAINLVILLNLTLKKAYLIFNKYLIIIINKKIKTYKHVENDYIQFIIERADK
jgi:hypothetical protein